jgi:Tol biopolymer transport system component
MPLQIASGTPVNRRLFHWLLVLPVAHALAAAPIAAPELFAPDTISTTDDESGIAFMPDGHTAYFTKRSPTTNTPPRSVICVSRLVDGHWSEPEIAAFSGTYNDFGIAIAADGRRMVFTSDRPNPASEHGGEKNFDLWIIDREGDGWSEPRNPGAPLDTPQADAYPSLAADGTLYFASTREGGKGGPDLYRARRVDGRYAEPENLGDINGAGYESQPAIAPDQRTLVFVASDRDDTLRSNGAPYSRPDLYVSFRSGEHWRAPRHLDAPISSPANENAPSWSPDGRWFYFASDRSFVSLPMPRRLSAREYEAGLHGVLDGWGNIYRVSSDAIELLRDQGVSP